MPPVETPRVNVETLGLYQLLASDLGFKAWNYPPAVAAAATIMPTAGRLEVCKINLRRAESVTNIHMQLTTAGSTLTSGRNFIGLFQNKTLVGSSADMKATWEGATGLLTMALASGPFTVQAGDLYVGLFYTGTTAPTFARATATSIANGLLAAEVSQFGSADTGLTTALPTTLGTISATTNAWWVGLS